MNESVFDGLTVNYKQIWVILDYIHKVDEMIEHMFQENSNLARKLLIGNRNIDITIYN